MRTVNYYFLYAIVTGLFGCTAGTSMSTTDNTSYREDLSVHRLDYATLEEPASNADKFAEIPISGKIEPQSDITEDLDIKLAEIAQNNKNKVISGYTILVYSGPSRDQANNAKDMIYRLLPNSRPQIQYVQPYYKVKVGKFIERLEAQKDFITLKKEFSSAMIAPEKFTIQ